MPKGDLGRDWNWTPSIFMPRWASRITLEITGIRVERVQDITEEDAIKEGATDYTILSGVEAATQTHLQWPQREFSILWDSIYSAKGLGWEKNPFVWVVEFRRVT
jgi:hypothetical protein